MSKKIQLTQGKYAIVDDDDYERLSIRKWYAQKGGIDFIAARQCSCPYYDQRFAVLMHRQITSCPRGLQVDHINHNTLDNRKCNLRICTNSQNHGNMIIQRDKSSKYKGVTWNSKRKKWIASIGENGKNYYLGSFEDEIEAAKTYIRAARKQFGDFALVNTI